VCTNYITQVHFGTGRGIFLSFWTGIHLAMPGIAIWNPYGATENARPDIARLFSVFE